MGTRRRHLIFAQLGLLGSRSDSRSGDRGRSLAAIALGVAALLAGLVTPWLLKKLVDDAILGGRLAILPVLATAFAVALVAEEALGLAAVTARTRFALAAAGRLRARILGHYLSLPAERYAQLPAGEMIQLLGDGAATARHHIATVLLTTPVHVATAAVVSALLVWLSPPLALLVLGSAPLVWFATRHALPAVRSRRRAAFEAETRVITWLDRVLSRARTLRVLERSGWARARYEHDEAARAEAVVRLERARELSARLARVTTGLVTLALLCAGAVLIDAGRLSLGELVAFNALAVRLLAPIRALVAARAERAATEAVLERVEAFLATEVERDDGDAPFVFEHSLALDDVHVSYDEGRRSVLRGLSLTIAPGERLAIVGPSGAGKTTLLDVLTRLLSVHEGRVTLDGRPASDVRLRDWRSAVRLVEQEAPLLAGSLRESVALGDPLSRSSSGDIEAALRRAGMSETVARLPDGLDTAVGEGGSALSGGERRRVALARALVSRPSVLLLDEPFSGLDAARRAAVRADLRRLSEEDGVALVLVTHDPRDAEALCDRAVMLDGGRVAWQGPAEELITKTASERIALVSEGERHPERAGEEEHR